MSARPEGIPSPQARPGVVIALAVWFALMPVLQVLSLVGLRVGNFGPDRPWNYLAYGLAAPYVAWLVWNRRPRARFAAYVFLTHETVRGLHFHRRDAVAAAMLWVVLLQLPAARRWMPSLRPSEMRERWRRSLMNPRGAPRQEPTSPSSSSNEPPRAS
jgi:hypothetical protein